MASPSTAEEADAPSGDATPLPGTVQVAAGLHARRTPLIDTPRFRVLEGIGDVGRAARRFSALTGLSLSARRAMQAQRSDVRRQLVRPPDYWSGYQEEEEERIAGRASTGDAALDKLIARRATQKREASARPRVMRGLPSTIHRRSHSVAGPMTAPGGMARRLLPAAVVPAPNPANSPQTAASREPRPARPTRPARPGQGDRPRPAAPPAPEAPVARRVADQPPRRDEPVATSASADLGPTSASAPPAGSSTTTAPVRRSAAPSELDPGAGVAADLVASAAPAASEGGRDVIAGPAAPAVSEGGRDVIAGATPPGARRRTTAPAADARPWSDDAPAWPGDLPAAEAPAPSSPFAATTVGRPVAVRPLLAGWRAPTAWRSIAAAPGLRLLPVGPAGLPTASSSSADADGSGSWADTVRRAVSAATSGPGSVRNLPVGGPAVVVRRAEGDVAGSTPGARRESVTRSGNAAARTSSSPTTADRLGTRAVASAEADRATARAERRAATATASGPSSSGASTAASIPSSAPAATSTTSPPPGRVARRLDRSEAPAVAARTASSADTWSSVAGGRRVTSATGSPIFLRRHVTASPSGSAVDVTAWALPPGRVPTATPAAAGPLASLAADGPAPARSTTAVPARTIRRAPGFRPADARRPGGWLGRAAVAGATGAPSGGVHRVPMGPLGPVRWSARADEPVVARSASPGSSWAASVAAAAAVMGGTASITGGAIRPPVTNGLTLVRGGRADGADLAVPSIQRSSSHPAATRLRLVPPTSERTDPTDVRRTTEVGGDRRPAATSRSTSSAGAPAAYVGRAPAGSAPFVSIPGAVAAHGLPSARASLVGVTASGPGAGVAATPGALGRLVHGEPIRRRVAYDLAPPALVGGSGGAASTAPVATGSTSAAGRSIDLGSTTPASRFDRPGLPATPAALVRRRLAEQLPVGPSADRSGGFGATWAQRVAAAAGTGGPAAVARLMAANPAAPPSWGPQGSTAPLGARPSTSIRRSATDEARSSSSATSARPSAGERPTTTRRSSADTATSTPAAPTVTASAWAERIAAAGPGRSVPGAQRAASPSPAGPTWAQRVAAAGEGRVLPAAPAATSAAATAPGSLLAPPVYATGGASVASLRGLPVAPAAFGVVRASDPSAAVGGRTTSSASANASRPGHPSGAADGSGTIHRSRTPHGVSATVARRLRDHRPGLVADRWRGADVPARALPGRAPTALRPIAAPEVVRRTPIRASAPGAAARFDEVLRSTGAPVRPVALPVRFRPLAERIIGRMPVQIATGVASQRALAAVGTTAATTGSVIHLPSAPDGSARMAGILAHELTHVAAASPVARFHGGRPSIEETAATQVERIVARAARTGGTGRGPASPGTSGLPVGGFVGVKGASAGPPVPASAASPSGGSPTGGIGGGSTGGSGGTVQRVVAQSEALPPAARPNKAADQRIQRKSMGTKAPKGLESVQEAADETNVLSDDALDTIVRALEARLLESIERRGGLWRGGF